MPRSRRSINLPTAFSDTAEPLNGLVSDSGDQASELKAQLLAQTGLREDAEETPPAPVAQRSRQAARAIARAARPRSMASRRPCRRRSTACWRTPPALTDARAREAFAKWQGTRAQLTSQGLPAGGDELRAWNPDKPVAWYRALTSFLFGRDWVTASFWQDWYGIIPLFVGSRHGLGRRAGHRACRSA